jgi:hexokinase
VLRRCQKLISGRYLGEILRLVICELIDEGVLFLGQQTYKIEIPYSFDTAFLSLMESYAVPCPLLLDER